MNREELYAKIRTLPEREVQAVGKRRRILGNVLNALNARLARLSLLEGGWLRKWFKTSGRAKKVCTKFIRSSVVLSA
jgi:hypothetical protein